MDVSRPYLLACAQTQQWVVAGVDTLEQKQPSLYYQQVLSLLEAPSAPSRPMLVDDSWDAPLALLDVQVDAKGEEQEHDDAGELPDIEGDLAIDEEAPGQPQPAHVAAAASASAAPSTLASLSEQRQDLETIGPFTLRVQYTAKASTVETKYIARCPFHKDPMDPDGSFCGRSITFNCREAQEQARSLLLRWMIQRRHCTTRALQDTADDVPHKMVKNADLIHMDNSDEQLLKEFVEGLQSDSWISGKHVVEDSDEACDGSDDAG